ncbi:hypothetical protein VP501E541_P0148 [Vibrio phage 501E54-1]|nr:hypothetical protein VP501E541_P0148 [Vibrio phage 501E54-1]
MYWVGFGLKSLRMRYRSFKRCIVKRGIITIMFT